MEVSGIETVKVISVFVTCICLGEGTLGAHLREDWEGWERQYKEHRRKTWSRNCAGGSQVSVDMQSWMGAVGRVAWTVNLTIDSSKA